MTEPAFLFVESNTSGTGRLFVEAAVSQGLRPIVLAADPQRYSFVQAGKVETARVDTLDFSRVTEFCAELARSCPIAGVTSSSEYFIHTAARLASELRLPGPVPDAVALARDKMQQRIRLGAAGVPVPDFRRADSVSAAERAADSLGYPVIVKPVQGTGSIDVRLCSNRSEVAAQAESILRKNRNERGQPVPAAVLVEQVADGHEYSAEVFGQTVVGITRKHLGELPHFVEIGHDFPAQLPRVEQEGLEQIALAALTALGLGWGPAHVEIRWTSTGPKIIEVNPRLAGGYIPELVRLACGIDLVSQTIRLAAGLPISLEAQWRRHSAIRFLLLPREGVFQAIRYRGDDQKPAVQLQVYSRPGDVVSRRGDFRDRLGHVIAASRNRDSARKAVERACAEVEIVVDDACVPA